LEPELAVHHCGVTVDAKGVALASEPVDFICEQLAGFAGPCNGLQIYAKPSIFPLDNIPNRE